MLEVVRSGQHAAPPTPGEVFEQRMLADGRFTRSELARALGLSPARMTMILKGRCQVSAEIALRIERVFGIPAHFWMRVRDEYELYQERKRLSATLASLTPNPHPAERIEADWPAASSPA